MNKIILRVLTIILLILIGCDNNTLSYQESLNSSTAGTLAKFNKHDDEYFPQQLAIKFITQAQDKIDKATEKADRDSANVDLTGIYDIITEADSILQEAKAAFVIEDYNLSIELAKDSKELASYALDSLDDILDSLDGEENDVDENTEFKLEYEVGYYTNVIIEANIVIPDSVLNEVEEFAQGLDSTVQNDIRIKLKLKLTENGLLYDLKVNGDIPPEFIDVPDVIGDQLNQIFESSNYNDFEVEIEIEVNLQNSEDDDDNGGNNYNADQAAKFIEQAQNKISLAEQKYNKALGKAGGPTIEIQAVLQIINQANDSLNIALNYNLNLQYAAAINAAKSAKELAGNALDSLELILDSFDDDEDNNDNANADQATKFITQAQQKIDKAIDKTNKASNKIDVSTIFDKIAEAETKLSEAQNAFNNSEYQDAIDLAKEAKELASEALDMLEDLLENSDDDDSDD